MTRFIVFFGLVVLVAFSTQAKSAGQDNKLKGIQSEINALAGNIARLEKEQGELQEQLAEIEKRYGKTVASLHALRQQIALKEEKLRALRTEAEHLQADIREQHKGLNGQVKAAYAMGRKEKLKLMLNQQDPVLSSRIMVYYDYLNKERLSKLQRIESGLKRIGELELAKQQETEQLALQLERVQKEQTELASARAQRQAILVKLDKEYSSSKLKLSRLKDGERRLQGVVQGLQRLEVRSAVDEVKPAKTFAALPGQTQWSNKSFASLQGKLPWPIKGQIVKKFGNARLESRWDGVLIAAPEGAEIRAISKGTVVFADWLRGYGLLTIIDHGGGFMTLYAFNQSLYRAVGERVAPGDVVAAVGKSGGRDKAGLYFGIRKQGSPVDPVRWCRKIDRDRVQ